MFTFTMVFRLLSGLFVAWLTNNIGLNHNRTYSSHRGFKYNDSYLGAVAPLESTFSFIWRGTPGLGITWGTCSGGWGSVWGFSRRLQVPYGIPRPGVPRHIYYNPIPSLFKFESMLPKFFFLINWIQKNLIIWIGISLLSEFRYFAFGRPLV